MSISLEEFEKTAKVTRVYADHQFQRLVLTASTEEPDYLVLDAHFSARDMRDQVRNLLGDPPGPMERAFALFSGAKWDPAEDYTKRAIDCVKHIASMHVRGIEVPDAAAKALINFTDWEAGSADDS